MNNLIKDYNTERELREIKGYLRITAIVAFLLFGAFMIWYVCGHLPFDVTMPK